MILNQNFNDPFDYKDREIEVMLQLAQQIIRTTNCCGGLGEKSGLSPDLMDIKVDVDNSCEDFGECDIALISGFPRMPQISFTLNYDDDVSCVAPFHCYLKIYYQRSPRNDEVLIDIGEVELDFPYEITYPVTTFLGTDWDVIQGGRAELIVNDINGSLFKSFNFSIKGQNPSAYDVFSYIDERTAYNNLWFMKKMILHESGTHLDGDITRPVKQFNPRNQSAEDLWGSWNASSRCPNRSEDNQGWGMGQLTNSPLPDKLTLWDWKANIASMVYRLVQTENAASPTRMNKVIANRIADLPNWAAVKQWNEFHDDKVTLSKEYAGVTWRFSTSPLFANLTNQSLGQFNDVLKEGEKSVLDGCLIKYYNDGNTHDLFMKIIVVSGKPIIKLQDNAGDYVSDVLTISIPQY